MKSAVPAIVALALVSSTCGLPVGTGTGVDLVTGDLNSWRKDFVLAGQTISLGLGYKKGGTIAASAGIIADINGQTTPISAAIITNINSPKTFQYQIGAQILNKITGILWGSTNGTLKYVINAWPIQVSSKGDGVSIGVGIEGDKLKPELLGAAVGYGSEVANVQIGLDSDYKPDSVNVALVGNTNGPGGSAA